MHKSIQKEFSQMVVGLQAYWIEVSEPAARSLMWLGYIFEIANL